MATTIDKDLFDSLIKNQIRIGRYSAQQAADLVILLNKTNSEIIAKILERGKDGTFTSRRLNALLAELQGIIADTYNEASDKLRTEMAAFAEHSAEVAGAMIATQLPVTWKPVGISDTQLAAILDKTPIRIGKDQSLLFDEIFKALAGGYEEKVRGALRLGMVQGESVHDMVKRLEGTAANKFKDGVLEGPRRELYNLTHTVTQFVNNQAAAATMQNNSEVVKGFLSIVTLDSKSCLFCVNAASKEYKLTDTGPIWHIGCRCFRAPIVRTWKELGFDMPEFKPSTRASQGGQIAADTTYDQWLRTRPVSEQIEFLGPARQKMFANGMKVDKFTDASGKTYTLDQLKSKNKH